MIRTATLCAIVASVSLSAQTPPAPASMITVTGCVAEAQRDGSTGAKATGTQATRETGYQLLDAKPAIGEPSKTDTTAYALQGHEAELAKHVGHRVEVAGSLMAPLAAKLPPKSAATAEGVRTVQVSSMKMVGTNCSAKASQ